MKIVVLDGYTENPGDLSWDELSKLGDLTVYDRVSYEESPVIREKIGDADIVITNKTPISRETIDACPNLKAIAVLATGYNVIDYEYAAQKNIPVMNVPTYGTQIVGQYAVGLLLEICSHYAHHDQAVKEGRWEHNQDWCFWDYPMIELYGKTAGIIGLGRIGQSTAKILDAMNMKVIAFDTFQSDAGRQVSLSGFLTSFSIPPSAWSPSFLFLYYTYSCRPKRTRRRRKAPLMRSTGSS